MPLPLPDPQFADMPYGSDPWTLVARDAALHLPQTAAVFTIGDGFVGVRGPSVAADQAAVFLNGVFETTDISYHEAAHGFATESDTRFPVADATAIHVEVGGQAMTLLALELDLRSGIRREHRALGGVEALIETVVPLGRHGVVATRVTVRGTRDLPVRITRTVEPPPVAAAADTGVLDPRVGPAAHAALWQPLAAVDVAGACGRLDGLPQSGFVVAAIASPLAVELPAGSDDVSVEAMSVYAAGRDGGVLPPALAALASAMATGFVTLAAEAEAALASFWSGAAVDLAGDPRASQALRHGLLQLAQAAGRDGRTSLAAKGQSGEGYEGHVFWDAESYALPALNHLAPATARAMLGWRIGLLQPARANARAMGHEHGALYPWRTIAGRECSAYFPAGSAQYHINADIALALGRYVDATGDASLLADGGAEMVAETARIWLQIGFHDPARSDAFVINRVTGPDEYSALVDNNYYTNLLAAEHLRLAVRLGAVTGTEAAAMARAADAMLLPNDAARGVPAQDDRFFALDPWPFAATPADNYPLLLHYHPLTIYRHRVAKQADMVLAVALYPERFDADARRRVLDVYEPLTTHDSTLSASAFATLAAQAGDAPRAARYWRVTALTDVCDLFGNTDHGLHMAALAGGWNALAFGFAGLSTQGGRLRLAPVFAPEVGPYTLRFHVHGRQLTLAVDAERCRLSMADGDVLDLTAHGRPVTLTPVTPATWTHP